jgi:predicted ATPase
MPAPLTLTKPLSQLKIPPTVQAILAARIDRLRPAAKDLLQTLAVIGKEFPLALARRVVSASDDELDRMLSDLQLAEFIYELPAAGDIEYMFKHALTQEVAYNSVLQERRRALHEQIARAIETSYAARLDDHLGELAHHYRRSANVRKAVEYLGRAAAQAADRSAFGEALEQLRSALTLLPLLPDSPERIHLEIELQTALAQMLGITKGPGGDECGTAGKRARELALQVGDDSKLLAALAFLRLHHFARGELTTALEVAEQFLAAADRAGDSSYQAVAHFHLTHTLLQLGEFDLARKHSLLGIELHPSHLTTPQALGDPKVVSLNGLAISSWMLGYPTQAINHSRESVRLGRESRNSVTIALAFWNGGFFDVLVRDAEAALELGEAAIAVASEHGFGLFEQFGRMSRSWALAARGQAEEAIGEMRAALEAFEQMGNRAGSPRFLSLLADACLASGHVDDGLAAVEKGFEVSSRTSEGFAKAELHRLKGELLLMHGRGEEETAANCFQTAIEIARGQRARSWELRATMSLARLLKKQGKPDEARTMLAEIYSWFTEGFDTADMKDAKALLDELSG